MGTVITINFLYSGFLLGYLNHKQISDWADVQLTKGMSEDILVDISLCQDSHTLISLLQHNRDENFSNILDYYLSLYKILGSSNRLSYDFLSNEILSAYRICNDSFQYHSFIEMDEKYNLFFTRLQDHIELLRDGFTGSMNMSSDLIHFLSKYNEDITIFKKLSFNVGGVQIATL